MTATGPRSSSGFRRVDERTIHTGRVIEVVEGRFETPDGEVVEREIVRHPGAVGVVPVDGDEVILVRQYRAAADADLLEIPAGKRDIPGESASAAAGRELAEEIGYVAGSLVELAGFYNSVGFSDEYSRVFLATALSPATPDPQGPEEQYMTVERLSLDAVPAAISDGRIEDAKTIIGLLAALRHLQR